MLQGSSPLYTLVQTFTTIHLQVPYPTNLSSRLPKETTYNLTPSTLSMAKKVTGHITGSSCLSHLPLVDQQPWEHGETCYFSGTKPILDMRSEGGCVIWKEKKFLAQNVKSQTGRLGHAAAWPSPTPLEAKPLRIKVTFKPLDKFPA